MPMLQSRAVARALAGASLLMAAAAMGATGCASNPRHGPALSAEQFREPAPLRVELDAYSPNGCERLVVLDRGAACLSRVDVAVNDDLRHGFPRIVQLNGVRGEVALLLAYREHPSWGSCLSTWNEPPRRNTFEFRLTRAVGPGTELWIGWIPTQGRGAYAIQQ